MKNGEKKKTDFILGECADEDPKTCEEVQMKMLKEMFGGKNDTRPKKLKP